MTRVGVLALFACVGGLVLGPGAPVRARVLPHEAAVPTEARAVLEEIVDAFVDGDHRALAALVHPDGVRLGLGPDPERITELTPAQSHYYFKALFQASRTVGFEYLRRQSTADDRVLARASWRRLRKGLGEVEMQRLLVTLARHPDGWRLTELTALRGG